MYDLVLIVIIWCVLLAVWGWFKPRPLAPPMYPGALPLIGHAHQLIGDRIHLLKVLQKWCNYSLEEGGVIEVRVSLHKVYVVTDPEDSLVIASTCLDKPYLYNFAKDFAKTGLVTAKAPTWKVHRKLLNPAFNQQVLNTYLNEINVQAQTVVSQLAAEVGKEPFDMLPYSTNLTLKIVSRILLGLEPQDQPLMDKDYKKLLEDFAVTYIGRGQRVWLHLSYLYNRSALKRKEEELIEKMQDIVNPVILKRKQELVESKKFKRENSSEKFQPLLDRMLNLTNKQDAFTDDDIKYQINTFMAASYDTTSSALKYILLMLGSHQHAQERVYTELQEVFGQRQDTYCTKDDLPKLVYLEAVIKETLRLYPTIPVIARSVHTDVKLKNYTLPAGSTCAIGVYGINRHPMWGADVNEFRPERWLDPATLPDNPNAFTAFSIGKRNCIGKLYSVIIMKTVLAYIIRQYRITSDISNLESRFDVSIKAVAGDLIRLTSRS